MTDTTYRGIQLLELGANQYTLANAALENLSRGISGLASITVTGSNVTLTDADENDQAKNILLLLTGTSTGARQVIVPTTPRVYIVANNTSGGFSHTVKTSGGTGIAVAPTGVVVVACDGTNVIQAGGTGTYTDEMAQDAVGAMVVDTTLEYVDSTPLLRRAAITGDVTLSTGSNTATIPNNIVTYAKMQDVSAASKLVGRGDSGAGDPQEITLGTGLTITGTTIAATASSYTDEQAQDAVGAMIDTTLEYVDNTPLLRRAAITGDVTILAGSNAATIPNDTVTFAKMQNLTTDRLLGRDTAGTGDTEEVTVGNGLEFTGGPGIGIANDGVTYARMQNVSAASKLLGRGSAGGAGDPEEITLGTGLSMSTTTLNGTSTQGKHTIWIPASSMWPATTAPAVASTIEMATNKNNLRVLGFADSTALYAHFQIAFPKAWNVSTITYKVYWTLNSTSTNSAVWGLQAVACSDGDVLDVAYGTAQEVTDAGLGTTAYKAHISAESSALTIAGTPAAEDLVDFRFYRDPANGSDNLAVTAYLLGIKLYYTTNADTDT